MAADRTTGLLHQCPLREVQCYICLEWNRLPGPVHAALGFDDEDPKGAMRKHALPLLAIIALGSLLAWGHEPAQVTIPEVRFRVVYENTGKPVADWMLMTRNCLQWVPRKEALLEIP